MAAARQYHCDNQVITGHGVSVYGDRNTVTGNNTQIYGDNNLVTGNSVSLYGDRNTLTGNEAAVYGDNNAIVGTTRYLSGNGNSVVGPGGASVVSAGAGAGRQSFSYTVGGIGVTGTVSGTGHAISSGGDALRQANQRQREAHQRQREAHQRQREANQRQREAHQRQREATQRQQQRANTSSTGGVHKRPIVRRLGPGSIYIQRRDGGLGGCVALGSGRVSTAGVTFPPGTRTGGISATSEGSTVSGLSEDVIKQLLSEYPDDEQEQQQQPEPPSLNEVLEKLLPKDRKTDADKDDDDPSECTICCERVRCVALDPCGDVAGCVECTKQLVKDNKIQCPICRQECTKVAFARV